MLSKTIQGDSSRFTALIFSSCVSLKSTRMIFPIQFIFFGLHEYIVGKVSLQEKFNFTFRIVSISRKEIAGNGIKN